MSILALIPARAGSKRVPGKNIKNLCGKPLLTYTINVAKDAECFDNIVVSTDNEEIAEISLQYGAEVPWLRSAGTATDNSSSVDVVLEVLDRIEEDGHSLPDAIMLLQPTSPFRTVHSIKEAISKYMTFDGDSIVSVSPSEISPEWLKFVAQDDSLIPMMQSSWIKALDHNHTKCYRLNGLIYLSSVRTLRSKNSFYSDKTRALIIENEEEALDIDTHFDWFVAEAICQKMKGISE